MAKMREELKPGMTENELWSHLHQVNIARGGIIQRSSPRSKGSSSSIAAAPAFFSQRTGSVSPAMSSERRQERCGL